MFIAELAVLDASAPDTYDLSSLRTGMMAGSPCPVEVMKQVVDRMGMTEVTIGYGMTETSPISTQTRRRRLAGAPGVDRGPGPPARRDQDRRPGDRGRRCRAACPGSSAPAATR